MRKFLLLVSAFTLTSTLVAQQDMLITQFVFNKISVNPASTGMDEGICVTSLYRNQWDKVYGAPNSAVLNVDANLSPYVKGGFGLVFNHDAIGFIRQNNVLLNYSYPIEVEGSGTLAFGLGLGMLNFGMNEANWVTPSVPSALDNTIPNGFASTKLDANFGVYWKGASDYYVGLSSTHVNESLLTQSVNNVTTSFQTRRHYYVMGGKTLRNVWGGDIDIQGLVRSDMVKSSFDLNARYFWKGMLYGGIAYRFVDAAALMLGYMPVQNFTIGYSYDLTTNKLSNVSKGTHEVALKYCFKLPTPPITRSNHPRWL